MSQLPSPLMYAVVQSVDYVQCEGMMLPQVNLFFGGQEVVLEGWPDRWKVVAVNDQWATDANRGELWAAFLHLVGRPDLVSRHAVGQPADYIPYLVEMREDLMELGRQRGQNIWQGVSVPVYREPLAEGIEPEPLAEAVERFRNAWREPLYAHCRKDITTLARLGTEDGTTEVHLTQFRHNVGVDLERVLRTAALAYLHSLEGHADCARVNHDFNFSDLVESLPEQYLSRFGIEELADEPRRVFVVQQDELLCPHRAPSAAA